MDRNHTRGRTFGCLTALLLAPLLASPAVADEEALFVVDRDSLVKLAIAAAQEEFPDIAPDDLIFEKSLYLWCNIAEPDVSLSPPTAEALSPCIAELYITRLSSRVELLYRDPDGRCMNARSYQTIGVKVEVDGTASVGYVGSTSGGGTADNCGQDLDQLPVCYENPLGNPESCE